MEGCRGGGEVMFKQLLDHIFNPLNDKQNRLRVGCLAWQGGVEKTQKELKQQFVYCSLDEIKECQKEYEEWLKSPEALELKDSFQSIH